MKELRETLLGFKETQLCPRGAAHSKSVNEFQTDQHTNYLSHSLFLSQLGCLLNIYSVHIIAN